MTVETNERLAKSVAWIAGLLTVVGLLVGGSVARLASAKRRVATLEQEIATKRASLWHQPLADEHAAGLQTLQAALLEWRGMTESESDRIAELSAVARDSGVTIRSLRSEPGAEGGEGPCISRTHRLSGVGTYQQLARFLDGVYGARGMAAIDELVIEGEESGSPELLRASLAVTWRAPNPGAGAGAEAPR